MLANLLSSSQRLVRDPGWQAWGDGTSDQMPGMMGGNTAAGQAVNTRSALQLLTVYACVSFLSDAFSLLPLCVQRPDPSGDLADIKPPAWVEKPNPDMSGVDLPAQFVTSILLDGNFYAIPVLDSRRVTSEVYTFNPNDVRVTRETGKRPVYNVLGTDVQASQIVHVKGLTWPGDIVGMSPVAYCRQTIGAGLAMEEFAGRWFAQGSSPSGVVEVIEKQTPDQVGMLRDQFEKFHKGIRNSHGVAVLSGGATYRPITMSNKDAQFLEARNFTASEISAGIFRVPPDMVGATLPGGASITYQNITDRWTELVRRAIMPLAVRYQWMMTHQLLPQPQVAKVDLDEYLRADIGASTTAYAAATGNKPWMLPSEVRDKMALAPSTGFDNPEPVVQQAPNPILAPEAVAQNALFAAVESLRAEVAALRTGE